MATEFQVSQNLRQMQRKQFLHSLQLQNYAVFDNEVDSVRGVELDAIVNDRKPHLMGEANAILAKLIAETSVVRALKAACSQCCVNFESGSENLFRDPSVQAQIDYLCVLRVLCGGEFQLQMMVP